MWNYRGLLTERQKSRVLAVTIITVVTLVTIIQLNTIGYNKYNEDDIEDNTEVEAPTKISPRQTQAKRMPQLSSDEKVEILIEGPLNATDARLVQWVNDGAGGRFIKPSTLPYNITYHNLGNFQNTSVYKFYVDKIDKLLVSKVGGFFIEAGALDGYLLSTTLRLEKDRAWSGILVEPRPDMFQQLLDKQRKAYTARFCLAEQPYPYKTNFWMSPDFVKGSIAYGAVGSKIYDKIPIAQRETGSVVNVQCIPAVTLLTAINITHVDLFVLDVEGAEWGVIQHFPFHTITVDMLAVERKNKGKDDRKAFIKLIQSKGFILMAAVEEDYVFVRKGAQFLIEN